MMELLNKDDIQFLNDLFNFDVEIYDVYEKLGKLDYEFGKEVKQFKLCQKELANKLAIEESMYNLNIDLKKINLYKEYLLTHLKDYVKNDSKSAALSFDRLLRKINSYEKKGTFDDLLNETFLLDNTRNDLIFLDELCFDKKYSEHKKQIVQSKYDYIFTTSLLEKDLLKTDFHIDNDRYDSEDLLADFYHLDNESYLKIKHFQVLNALNNVFSNILNIPDKALADEEVFCFYLKNICLLKSLLLKLSDDLFLKTYETFMQQNEFKSTETINLLYEAFDQVKEARKKVIRVSVIK